MGGSEAGVAIFILVVFLAGAVLGVVAMVSVAVHREDRRLSLSGAAPGAMARGARWLTGFGSRGITVPLRSRGR